jgi:hypothetical protein
MDVCSCSIEEKKSTSSLFDVVGTGTAEDDAVVAAVFVGVDEEAFAGSVAVLQ